MTVPFSTSSLQPFSTRPSHWQTCTHLVLQNIAHHWDLLAAVELFDAHPTWHADFFFPPRAEKAEYAELTESDMRNWDPRVLEELGLLAENVDVGDIKDAVEVLKEKMWLVDMYYEEAKEEQHGEGGEDGDGGGDSDENDDDDSDAWDDDAAASAFVRVREQ
ncbi:hypothetical protein BU23DRAFT_571103 [Bimuria novae-zelandiae CBS 107.79]|uniref:Uncharacterized protein n=1 Tax=Bimuria novae-zelandiae CBS 107.79 TaxID=1447943 RepID=A0A6A5V4T6_9PLEO|nr:hypothetical protein BU23DRAFT_571103 [Bimuria novae-zelandiae CBS 107.79]